MQWPGIQAQANQEQPAVKQRSELLGTHVRHKFCLLKPHETQLFHQDRYVMV